MVDIKRFIMQSIYFTNHLKINKSLKVVFYFFFKSVSALEKKLELQLQNFYKSK